MHPANHTILLIDDETRLLMGLTAMIKRAGYQVLSAGSGEEGLRIARSHQPDLIVCDVMMPPPNGFKVKQILSEDPATDSIPFIFLTARTSQADVLHGFRLNGDDYITKPFNRDELLARIEAVLRRREISREEGRTETEAELDALRREIIQNVSHELRTPIAVLLPTLEMFLEDRFANLREEERQFLQMAVNNAHRLRWLVEDILILAGIDQGRHNTFRQPINPHHHLIEPIEQLWSEYKDKNLQTQIHIDPVINLTAPLPDFTRAVLHLVDNACKFSPDGGRVDIQVSTTSDQTIITVSDEGPGIPTILRQKVFDRFYQIAQGTTRPHNGLGVGLTIARAVVRAIGGEVVILDTKEGCVALMAVPNEEHQPEMLRSISYEQA